jgi:hypothetical protein
MGLSLVLWKIEADQSEIGINNNHVDADKLGSMVNIIRAGDSASQGVKEVKQLSCRKYYWSWTKVDDNRDTDIA